ncbi:MAG: UDP-N-acetylglucosamine 1-carboxyvinyltransferase [Bacteroidia bacterium]|jgi:UDP-N-acetylglucosamine 1-carboxyvinyltransferase|nr:UDP-N-acetylglucosamine 1-carboxyvinyltransferase [Bacteroidia bacterium]MBP7261923.1 UDP-N-acetylglucosamine 1-carboxyvinyltransferase [Bacteroidia bacterium]
MGSFKITGGHSLSGSVIPQGAKNEALQIISGVLLTSEKVTISNIPNIRDVMKLIELIGDMGVQVNKVSEDTFTFEAKEVNLDYLRSEDFRKKGAALRGSIMIIGPLLARYGLAYIPEPGGDKIGRRPVDTHLRGFEALGATFEHLRDERYYKIDAKNLRGTYMVLDEASVTGTANILMAASLAKGTTQIYNAACEPYLQQLCKMINRMGGKISGIGSNLLTIEGVESLGGCEHRMLPDMIEIGSFIGLAATTNSEITIKDCSIPDLGVIPSVFRKMGIEMEFRGDDIYIPKQDSYKIQTLIDGSMLTIRDGIWPAFTPDLISIALVTATQAKGSVLIHQWMFESRLFFVDNLIDMGAKIILCDPHRAVVIGSNRETKLRGITMSSPDIRAGVAMLIAALAANGTSTINNIEQIDRGYQYIDTRLRALGAKIDRID